MAYRNRWNHQTAFSAAHNAVAAASTAALPQFPPADLVAKRIALVPHHTPFDPKTAPADLEALVLAIPFGKRNSGEVRQWAKKIGARFQMSTKQWLISKSRLTADAVKIINELRLWAGAYERVSVAFVPRIYCNSSSRVILKVPYENRADAKAAGAQWDTGYKYWYFTIPHNADLKFSEKIADFEMRGWVDADATDKWNVGYIHAAIPAIVSKPEDLKALRPKTEAEARSQVFANAKSVGQAIGSKGVRPGIAPNDPLLEDEVGFLNLILAYYNNGRGANTITQYTFGKDNATSGWRMDTLEGSTVVRITNWDITSRGEITNRRHTYLPKDDARKVWDIVLQRGYTVANTASGDAVEALVCIGAGLTVGEGSVTNSQFGYSQGLLESASRNIRERLAGIRKAGLA